MKRRIAANIAKLPGLAGPGNCWSSPRTRLPRYSIGSLLGLASDWRYRRRFGATSPRKLREGK